MITLEQIRLLESKIARAIELIRVLKEENGTLRKGLESAQKRMKELEGLVDGFQADQNEIETVIVRTLRNLDELEESAVAGRRPERAASAAGKDAEAERAHGSTEARPAGAALSAGTPSAAAAHGAPAPTAQAAPAAPAAKEELDIF